MRQVLNKSISELSPDDHPLIFAVNMSTGKRFHTRPSEVWRPACLPTLSNDTYQQSLRLSMKTAHHVLAKRSCQAQVLAYRSAVALPSCTLTLSWYGQVQVLAYQSAVVLPPYPPGTALGFFGGLQFGLGLKRADVRAAFDATLGRTVTMAYAGQPPMPANQCGQASCAADRASLLQPLPLDCCLQARGMHLRI